jgi:hypothetical protein
MCAGKKLRAFYSSYVDATAEPQLVAEDKPCDAIVLSVWAVEDDTLDTIKPGSGSYIDDARQEIYWGVRNCVHPIYPGDTSDYIYVANANDISVRRNKQKGETTRVAYTLFKFVEE